MTKLFVGGIPYSITNEKLEEIFSKFGSVVSAQIITDKFSGQSKGFAFVEMSNDSEAQAAIKEMDGQEIDGRRIGVSVARPKEDRPNNNRSSFSNSNREGFRRDNPRRGNSSFSRGNNRR